MPTPSEVVAKALIEWYFDDRGSTTIGDFLREHKELTAGVLELPWDGNWPDTSWRLIVVHLLGRIYKDAQDFNQAEERHRNRIESWEEKWDNEHNELVAVERELEHLKKKYSPLNASGEVIAGSEMIAVRLIEAYNSGKMTSGLMDWLLTHPDFKMSGVTYEQWDVVDMTFLLARMLEHIQQNLASYNKQYEIWEAANKELERKLEHATYMWNWNRDRANKMAEISKAKPVDLIEGRTITEWAMYAKELERNLENEQKLAENRGIRRDELEEESQNKSQRIRNLLGALTHVINEANKAVQDNQ